eukprot:445962_1
MSELQNEDEVDSYSFHNDNDNTVKQLSLWKCQQCGYTNNLCDTIVQNNMKCIQCKETIDCILNNSPKTTIGCLFVHGYIKEFNVTKWVPIDIVLLINHWVGDKWWSWYEAKYGLLHILTAFKQYRSLTLSYYGKQKLHVIVKHLLETNVDERIHEANIFHLDISWPHWLSDFLYHYHKHLLQNKITMNFDDLVNNDNWITKSKNLMRSQFIDHNNKLKLQNIFKIFLHCCNIRIILSNNYQLNNDFCKSFNINHGYMTTNVIECKWLSSNTSVKYERGHLSEAELCITGYIGVMTKLLKQFEPSIIILLCCKYVGSKYWNSIGLNKKTIWKKGKHMLYRKYNKNDEIEYDSDPEQRNNDGKSHVHSAQLISVLYDKNMILTKDVDTGGYCVYPVGEINIKLPPATKENTLVTQLQQRTQHHYGGNYGTGFVRIDHGLGMYYRRKKKLDYKNENGVGKFLQFVKDNEFDDDIINEQLNGGPLQCDYLDFDPEFPFESTNEDDYLIKKIEIMKIIAECYKK